MLENDELQKHSNQKQNISLDNKLTPIINALGLWDTPTSFDNSLSWYQAVKYVCEYLQNNVVPKVNDLDTFTANLQSYYEEAVDYINSTIQNTTDYINNYFDNLDVQQEINNKLDKMTQDGTLTILLNPLVNEKFNILNNEINVERQRINNLTQLEEGSTTGDAELIDIRTGANGFIYDTAGDSVRNQINDIPDNLGYNKIINFNEVDTINLNNYQTRKFFKYDFGKSCRIKITTNISNINFLPGLISLFSIKGSSNNSNSPNVTETFFEITSDNINKYQNEFTVDFIPKNNETKYIYLFINGSDINTLNYTIEYYNYNYNSNLLRNYLDVSKLHFEPHIYYNYSNGNFSQSDYAICLLDKLNLNIGDEIILDNEEYNFYLARFNSDGSYKAGNSTPLNYWCNNSQDNDLMSLYIMKNSINRPNNFNIRNLNYNDYMNVLKSLKINTSYFYNIINETKIYNINEFFGNKNLYYKIGYYFTDSIIKRNNKCIAIDNYFYIDNGDYIYLKDNENYKLNILRYDFNKVYVGSALNRNNFDTLNKGLFKFYIECINIDNINNLSNEDIQSILSNIVVISSENSYKNSLFYNFKEEKPNMNFTYSGQKIKLKNNNYNINYLKQLINVSNKAFQGFSIFNNFIFQLFDTGILAIYELNNTNNNALAYCNLGSYDSNNHANCANFSNKFYNNNSIPLLYVVGGNTGSILECNVENIVLTENENNYSVTSQLIQKITLDQSNFEIKGYKTYWGCPTWLTSTDNKYLYTFTAHYQTDGSMSDYDDINKYIITKFPYPNLSNQNVTLTADDIIEQYETDYMINYTQGGTLYKDYIFYTFGNGTSLHPSIIGVWNIKNKKFQNLIDLSQTELGNKELEDCYVFNDKLYVVCANGHLYEFEF